MLQYFGKFTDIKIMFGQHFKMGRKGKEGDEKRQEEILMSFPSKSFHC